MYIHAYTCITYAHIITPFCILRTKNLLKFPILKQKQTTKKTLLLLALYDKELAAEMIYFQKNTNIPCSRLCMFRYFCPVEAISRILCSGLDSSVQERKNFQRESSEMPRRWPGAWSTSFFEEKLRARRSGVQPGGDLEMI